MFEWARVYLPDMREQVLEWAPVGYPTHFGRTGFAERGLAIAGWLVAVIM